MQKSNVLPPAGGCVAKSHGRRLRPATAGLLVLLGLGFLDYPVQAESRLIFPRLSFEAGTFTGLAFVNPTDAKATITLRAWGTDGKLLAGTEFKNPVTLEVGARRQEAKNAADADLFGAALPADRVGWIEATSPVDGVTGFFLFLTGNLGQLDGADLPEPSEQIIFNQVVSEGDFTTELNVVNPGNAEVEVSYKLFGESLTQITKSFKIPPKGMLRHDAGQLFGLARIPAGAHVRVAANGPIAGFEFVRNRQGDLVGTNAAAERQQLAELFFPQMAVLGLWKTEIGLTNLSNSPVILTFSAYKGDGSLYTAPALKTNPVNRTLERQASVRLDVASLFGFSGNQTFDGWIKVTATSSALSGYVVYGLPSSGASALVAAAAGGRKTALFSHIATLNNPYFFTGLALLNPGTLAANVRIMAFTKGGQQLGSTDLVLRPGERVSKLINEFIGGAANRGDGFIWVKSDVPIYTTSLFGSTSRTSNVKVLANIPPQVAPDSYQPDQGIQAMEISPTLLTIQPDKTYRFTLKNAPAGIIWKVNGIRNGNATVGTISADGTYKAPAQVPPTPISVSAESESGSRAAGASVDVLKKDDLFSGLGVVQAITYLESTQRLYQTELLGVAGTDEGSAVPAAVDSRLSQFLPQGPTALVTFAGKQIVDMASWRSSSNKEFLLLASKNTGEILRFDPDTRQSTQVAKNLVEPAALVVDRVSGNLLVAERDRITTVLKSALESGLRPTPGADRRRVDPLKPRTSTVIPQAGSTGLVVDDCSGDVYFSNRQANSVSVFRRGSGQVQVITNELFGPTGLLAIYRRGVSCPAALNLLVIEEEAGLVSLLIPDTGEIYEWFQVPEAFDVEFLPENNPFVPGTAGVLLGEFANDQGELFFVDLPFAYDAVPTNILLQRVCQGGLFLGDPFLEAAIRNALGLSPGEVLRCELAEQLIVLEANHADIEYLEGLEFFPYLRALGLWDNFIYDLEPLRGLINLEVLDLEYNIIFDLEPLYDLYYMRELYLAENYITDLTPLEEMWDLEVLDLRDNLLEDISPLAFHLGLGEGDVVDLRQNLLDLGDCRDIQQLRIQKAEVLFDVPCEAELQDADLWLTVEAPEQAEEFGVHTYFYSIHNSSQYSNYDATNVLFVSILPEQSIFLDVDTGGYGQCEVFEDIVVACVFDSLELDTRLDMTIDVVVWGLAGDSMSSVSLISADQWDNFPDDNLLRVETLIVP